MWMFTLATAWGNPTVVPPAPTHAFIHSEMDTAMTHAIRPTLHNKKSITEAGATLCSDNVCQQIDHTEQEAYSHNMLEIGWLSMANRYGVGHELIPQLDTSEPRSFVMWETDFRTLWILMESGSPTSYYATWTFESLKPTANPFDPSRLQPLQQIINRWLSECNQTRPIDVDHRQNERSWSGTNCNGWDLWLEYKPTEERSLSILAVQR